jgi:hypothetical protein
MKKILIFIAFLFVLEGCATTQNYQQKLAKLQGMPAQTLINKWGQPNMVVKKPNGATEYLYKRTHLFTPPGYPTVGSTVMTPGGPSISPGYQSPLFENQTKLRTCITRFDVNHDGIITGSSFEGDNCIASNSSMPAFLSAGLIGGFIP